MESMICVSFFFFHLLKRSVFFQIIDIRGKVGFFLFDFFLFHGSGNHVHHRESEIELAFLGFFL